MSTQIDNRAPPGTLLKKPRLSQRKEPRKPTRERDENYLALIRQCPCLKCGQDPAGTAAHVRMSSSTFGKPNAGMRNKPDDKWTLPLCHGCHMEQHRIGELSFWYELQLNPVLMCVRLLRAGDLKQMRILCLGFQDHGDD